MSRAGVKGGAKNGAAGCTRAGTHAAQRTKALFSGTTSTPPDLQAFHGQAFAAQRGIVINKLATFSALPPSSIKNILYGKSQNPKIVTIKMICDGLEITLGELFYTPEFDRLEEEIN